MALDRRAALLAGFDPVAILEAASVVIADIEAGRFASLIDRLPRAEQAQISRWVTRVAGEGLTVAPTPIVALALLAATTLALGQSVPGERSDEMREVIANRLVIVGLRFNDDVVGGHQRTDDQVLAFMARSSLWRATESEAWLVWSGEVVATLSGLAAAEPVLQEFRERTHLTVDEWWCRGFGERSTRVIHGAQSWGRAQSINTRIEDGWLSLSTTYVADAVLAAQQALYRSRRQRPPIVLDPFNLRWLASRPVIATPDGRRFHLWLGALNRMLLLSVTAQVISDTVGDLYNYEYVAGLLGQVAQKRLEAAIDALPACEGELRWPDRLLASTESHCDFILEHHGALLAIEFTLMTPTRSLHDGAPVAVDGAIARMADKCKQIYSSLRSRDPTHESHWLPLLVLATPGVVDPLVNHRIDKSLRAKDVILEAWPEELMTCHAPEFLDLIELAAMRGESLVDLVREWRDGPQRGSSLDWWLSDREALGIAARRSVGPMTDHVIQLLKDR